MVSLPPDEATLNDRVAATLLLDHAANALGIRLVNASPGQAELEMTVTREMLNALGIQHGGTLFTLGDTCFAAVCVSLGRDAVSRQADITFVAPVRRGQVLSARGREVLTHGRNVIVDVTIADDEHRSIAELRVHGTVPRPASSVM